MVKLINLKPSFFDLCKEIIIYMLRNVLIMSIMLLIEICISGLYQGPFSKLGHSQMSGDCMNNWYKNLLFIHNHYDNTKICLSHTWSIAAEIQMFITSCLLTWLYSKNLKFGFIMNILLIIMSLTHNFIIAYINNTHCVFLDQFPLNADLSFKMHYKLHLNTFSHFYSHFFIYLIVYIKSNTERRFFSKVNLN